jgi:hypothetical protein
MADEPTPPAEPQKPPGQIFGNPVIDDLYKRFGLPGLLIAAVGGWFGPKHFEFMDKTAQTQQVQAAALDKMATNDRDKLKFLETLHEKTDDIRDRVKDVQRELSAHKRADASEINTAEAPN